MLEHRPLTDIAGVQAGWLNAKHHFALGSYGNPAHHPVGELYVWNDDSIAPHAGLPAPCTRQRRDHHVRARGCDHA